jgi:hypothetical protein
MPHIWRIRHQNTSPHTLPKSSADLQNDSEYRSDQGDQIGEKFTLITHDEFDKLGISPEYQQIKNNPSYQTVNSLKTYGLWVSNRDQAQPPSFPILKNEKQEPVEKFERFSPTGHERTMIQSAAFLVELPPSPQDKIVEMTPHDYDVWHFFGGLLSKGKKNDHVFHNACLEEIVRYYQDGRKRANTAALTKVKV